MQLGHFVQYRKQNTSLIFPSFVFRLNNLKLKEKLKLLNTTTLWI